MSCHSIKTLKERFELALLGSIENFGKKTPLRDAVEYALLSGGKRVRPLIVLAVADCLGDCDVMHAALSAEYFHTSSLIADDLPCMDDALERRGRATTHKVFGEPIALLASYALISAGFEGVHSDDMKEASLVALKRAASDAGIHGATGGQYLDMFGGGRAEIEELIFKKTVTLFDSAFIFGWAFGGGDLSRLDEVARVAYHFGMAFQIGDDLNDYDEDSEQKNYARLFGKEKALVRFEKELAAFQEGLRALNLESEAIQSLSLALPSARVFQ